MGKFSTIHQASAKFTTVIEESSQPGEGQTDIDQAPAQPTPWRQEGPQSPNAEQSDEGKLRAVVKPPDASERMFKTELKIRLGFPESGTEKNFEKKKKKK